jgi:hypothetical protein
MECFVTGHAVIDTISFQAGLLWIEGCPKLGMNKKHPAVE